MLKSAYVQGFDEFNGLESQIQFIATLNAISAAFNNAYIKWHVNGLGEAYGFWFKLKANKQPFIVKTFVNIEGLNADQSIEWHIDAKDTDCADQVFNGLGLNRNVITWKR